MADEELKEFNLVGGTALALMVGHRISVDIDLFIDNPFDAERLGALLSAKYKVDNLETDNNTINCDALIAKISSGIKKATIV
jgi:hypothetical protein